MSWKQNVTPNLDPYVYVNGVLKTDWFGWCLATVRCAYNAPYSGLNAWSGWLYYTKFRHEDRNFPIGVYFPIWYSGYGGQGHVAFAYVNTTGQMNIWTSPFTHTPYFYTGYHDVDALARGYGVKYAGWSEDIGGMRVVEWQEDLPPQLPPPPPPVEPTLPPEQPSPTPEVPKSTDGGEPQQDSPKPPPDVVVIPEPPKPPEQAPPIVVMPPAKPKPKGDRFWAFKMFVKFVTLFVKGNKNNRSKENDNKN